MFVCDIMTREPNCTKADATAQAAAELMRQWNTGVLPVVDNFQDRRIVGVVTDRDLMLSVIAAGQQPKSVHVSDCMSTDAICCEPHDDVHRALDHMRIHHVRRLPVTESDGRVVGVISISDIIRYAALSEAEIVAAVSHICEPLGAAGQERARQAVAD